jgi:hypothetical protein
MAIRWLSYGVVGKRDKEGHGLRYEFPLVKLAARIYFRDETSKIRPPAV